MKEKEFKIDTNGQIYGGVFLGGEDDLRGGIRIKEITICPDCGKEHMKSPPMPSMKETGHMFKHLSEMFMSTHDFVERGLKDRKEKEERE